MDRPEARPAEVVDEVLELLMDLEANDKQLDCPFLYASAKAGWAAKDLTEEHKNMVPLLRRFWSTFRHPPVIRMPELRF